MATEDPALEEAIEDAIVDEADVDVPKDDAPPKDVDWKAESRKHERRAKSVSKEKEALEARLREIEDSNKSESEKAIAKAREEAAAEERAKHEQSRRNDRLEVQVTRLAARTFADTEDALIHIQRAIDAGDVDADDIFDTEGKVQTDALKTALDELLERKPHLKAGANGVHAGDADAGKGKGPAKDAESLSVDEHLAQVQRR